MKKYMPALRDWQREYLFAAYQQAEGNVKKMVTITGINRTHIYKMAKKLGIRIISTGHGFRVSPSNRGNKAWQELI